MKARDILEAESPKNGSVKREWLAEPVSRRGRIRAYHWPNEMKVACSGGQFLIDATGKVKSWQALTEDQTYEGLAKVARFDLEEWRKRWPDKLPERLMLLDLGFWLQDGTYEAADTAFRDMLQEAEDPKSVFKQLPRPNWPTNKKDWLGARIRILATDRNEVEGRGEVTIPSGWLGYVTDINRNTDDDGHTYYDVVWDDDPAAPGGEGNMGWCIWSAEELANGTRPV